MSPTSYIGHTIISATYMDFVSHIIRNDDTIILSIVPMQLFRW